MVVGIGHVAFRVSNLESALDFYCRKLGLKEAFRLDRDGQPSPWIVYVQVAEGQFLELFPVGDRPLSENRGQTGYDHLCLLVDDLRATLHQLERNGLSVPGDPVEGDDRNLVYGIEDTDGNRIELVELQSGSPQAAAARAWQSRALDI